jgi:hypothetical protein
MYERMSGVREKIKRAEKHIEDFKTRLRLFMDSKPYALRVDVEIESANPTVHIIKADPVPPDLLTIAGDAIHNFRSSLDHLACALVRAHGNEPSKYVEFPILEGPITTAKIESAFAGKVQGMRENVQDAIRAIHPYQGGNNTLWRLHRLDVIDKHKMLVAALGNITAVNGFPPIEDKWDGNRWVGVAGVPLVLEEGQQFTFPGAKVDKSTPFFAEVVFNQSDVAEGYPMILALMQFNREVKKVIGKLSWALR